MEVREVDVAEFERLAGPLLASDPVRHTVPMGIVATLRRDPARYAGHSLRVALDGGRTAAAMLWTPPFHPVAVGDRDGIEAFAAALQADGPRLTGVNGTLPESRWLADAWSTRTGATQTIVRHMRLHALTTTRQVPAAAGAARPATAADRPVLHAWAAAFAAEVGTPEPVDMLTRGVDDAVGRPNGAMVWDDGGPVSMSMAKETGPGFARIGPVYTPPELRRRGYATTLVATQTEALQAAGAATCLLYTDLANPTSNAIYAKIGYEPVCDAAEIDL
jgi:predicted GNAT family acetyltransferase